MMSGYWVRVREVLLLNGVVWKGCLSRFVHKTIRFCLETFCHHQKGSPHIGACAFAGACAYDPVILIKRILIKNGVRKLHKVWQKSK